MAAERDGAVSAGHLTNIPMRAAISTQARKPADVGITYTSGLDHQLIGDLLIMHAEGRCTRELGVPHHALGWVPPNSQAGHVYLHTIPEWEGKALRTDQRRPAGTTDGLKGGWNLTNRQGQLVDLPGDPQGRKLHLEYFITRLDDEHAKKPQDPDKPNAKRGGLTRHEYRLVDPTYDPTNKLLTLECADAVTATVVETRVLSHCSGLEPTRTGEMQLQIHGPLMSLSWLLLGPDAKCTKEVLQRLVTQINIKAGGYRVPAGCLQGITFRKGTSLKHHAAALPKTALVLFLDSSKPNDERIRLPRPPIYLCERTMQVALGAEELARAGASGSTSGMGAAVLASAAPQHAPQASDTDAAALHARAAAEVPSAFAAAVGPPVLTTSEELNFDEVPHYFSCS